MSVGICSINVFDGANDNAHQSDVACIALYSDLYPVTKLKAATAQGIAFDGGCAWRPCHLVRIKLSKV